MNKCVLRERGVDAGGDDPAAYGNVAIGQAMTRPLDALVSNAGKKGGVHGKCSSKLAAYASMCVFDDKTGAKRR